MKPQLFSWKPTGGYRPNSPYTGDDPNYIFRGLNQIVKGNGNTLYCESWRGYLDLSETVTATTLTGTVATTANGTTVTGTSTLFLQELIVGQIILIANRLYQVRAIASNTSLTITPPALSTASGQTATLPHTQVDVDIQRGTLARGNIQRFPQGNLFVVGQGEVRLNGVTIPPSGLTATKRLKLAVYDPATGNYSVYPLGMSTPTLTTVAGTGGGTKNMQAGTYSVRIVPARTATGGYNQPSNKVEVTITAGQKIQITFPAMDTTAGQDAWDIYATLFSTGAGIQGPWYFVQQVTTAGVAAAGGTYAIEYNDAEIVGNGLLEFNNDPPPDAAFVASLQGYPILVSCNGAGRKLDGTAATTATSQTVTGTSTTWLTDINRGQIIYIDGKYYEVVDVASNTSMTVTPAALATASSLVVQLGDTAPGPVVRPSQIGNPEAFPAEFKVAVSPPENIIGFVEGGGRIFLMTENRLHMAVLSGNPDLPVTVRPFWRAGFRSPQALVFVNGYIYGYTTNGPTRSIADGDEGSEEHTFAADVASDMAPWSPERVRIGYDPVNEAVCFFHSDDLQNSAGYYYTTVLCYMLRLGKWSTPCVIGSETAHMVVSGVATVSGKLYFTANQKNYQWDAGTTATGSYIATPFMDMGEPALDKTVRGMALTAYSIDPINANIYAAQSAEDVPVAALVAGSASPDSGTITYAVGSAVRPTEWKKLSVRLARLFAIRANLGASSGNLGRLDEMAVAVSIRQNKH